MNGTYFKIMKHLLLTTIAAVVLVGCGPSAPDISIHEAVNNGNVEAVKQHLAAGTDVNAKDDSNITPLLWAINNSHEEIVELLISKGADVNFKDIAGQTPLDWAESGKFTEIADLLRKHGGKNGSNRLVDKKSEKSKPYLKRSRGSSIHVASYRGDIEIVKQYLTKGMDVNVRNVITGHTPLHEASNNGKDEIAKLLINSGADVNAKERGGSTPLLISAAGG